MSVGGATAFFLRTWCGKRELCLCGESKLLRNEVVLVLVLLVVRLSALATALSRQRLVSNAVAAASRGCA